VRYLSVCSGVEAASLGWHSLGWTPVGFSEIEPYPCRILADQFPHVKNYGDMTRYKEWDIDRESVDIIVGGTPCQAFSVAGMRKGMEDPRGNLALGFVGMVDFFRPEWVLWENVPGVLSSNGGRDFGSILGAFSELGYGWSYRVLDAQYFGVPQRRQRIFLVGHSSGDSRRAGKVLFESDCVRRHPSESRKTRQVTATATKTGTVSSKWAKGAGGPAGDEAYNLVTVMYDHHPNDSRVTGPVDESPTVAARWGTGGGNTPLVQHAYRKSRRAQSTEDHETWVEDEVANTLNTFDLGDIRSTMLAVQPIALAENTIGRQPENGGNGNGFTVGGPMYTLNATGVHGVAHTFKVRGGCEGGGKGYLGQDNKAFTISTSQDQYLSVDMVVRRLTPTECERLQGMPDGWAKAPGKESDSGRYKAIGNSMAVPVMKWIGERIQKESL
jgi:DNA (cytosine-5)-methyltransferase 1